MGRFPCLSPPSIKHHTELVAFPLGFLGSTYLFHCSSNLFVLYLTVYLFIVEISFTVMDYILSVSTFWVSHAQKSMSNGVTRIKKYRNCFMSSKATNTTSNKVWLSECFCVFFFYWNIVDLQCHVSVRYTAQWFSYIHIHTHIYEYMYIYMCIYICILFQILLPYRLLQNIE